MQLTIAVSGQVVRARQLIKNFIHGRLFFRRILLRQARSLVEQLLIELHGIRIGSFAAIQLTILTFSHVQIGQPFTHSMILHPGSRNCP